MSQRVFILLVAVCCTVAASARLSAQKMAIIDPFREIWVGRETQAARNNQQPGAVVSCVALSPDGSTVAAVGDDHIVRLYDAASGNLLKALPGHSRWTRCAAFGSNKGQTLITAGDDRKIIFWDAVRREHAHEINGPMANSAAFSPQGDQFAVVGFDRNLNLYDAQGRMIRPLACDGRDMRAVAFSPDGGWLAAGGRDGKLHVWQLSQQQRVEVGGAKAHRRGIFALDFSPDGRRLATAGDGEWIHVWDLQAPAAQPAASIRKFDKTRSKTRALVFCGPNRLAAGGTNNKIHVWDLSEVRQTRPGGTAREIFQMTEHKGSVTSLVYDAANDVIISGSYDTTVRFWRLGPRTTTPGRTFR